MKTMNIHRLLIAPLAAVLALSCEPKPAGQESFTYFDGVLLLPLSVNMLTGTTAQLGAQRFKDGTGTDKTADTTWSSSDNSVVTVSTKGRLTAKAPGRTTVKGTVDGKSASVQVIVEAPALQLLPVHMDLEYLQPTDGGDPHDFGSQKYVANLLLEDGGRTDVSDQMLWGSSDTSVASVTDGGVVTAVGAGDAVITGIYEGQTVLGDVTVSEVEE